MIASALSPAHRLPAAMSLWLLVAWPSPTLAHAVAEATRVTSRKSPWTANGGNVNYDLHGSPKGGGKETSYKKGREVASDSGTLTAAYDGSHGWFWRNRGSRDVTITLKTNGAYTEIKRVN
jgi:hypothetical protein